jgi:hypothetical protein
MRDLAFPRFEGFADGGDESWFTWAHQLSSFFSYAAAHSLMKTRAPVLDDANEFTRATVRVSRNRNSTAVSRIWHGIVESREVLC